MVLALSGALHEVPWESLPCMFHVPVYRQVSVVGGAAAAVEWGERKEGV